MNIKLTSFFLTLLGIVTACTATAIPVFDTSFIAVEARASAEVAIESTQVAVQLTQTVNANQTTTIDPVQTGDTVNGEVLFTTFQADAGFACSTCHFVANENRLIGPGLLNVSSRANNRVDGETAYDYIFTSITNPDAYIVDSFTGDLMPENWAEIYSEGEINDIIAYLWTLNG